MADLIPLSERFRDLIYERLDVHPRPFFPEVIIGLMASLLQSYERLGDEEKTSGHIRRQGVFMSFKYCGFLPGRCGPHLPVLKNRFLGSYEATQIRYPHTPFNFQTFEDE